MNKQIFFSMIKTSLLYTNYLFYL